MQSKDQIFMNILECLIILSNNTCLKKYTVRVIFILECLMSTITWKHMRSWIIQGEVI
jgi:hypothetical protein